MRTRTAPAQSESNRLALKKILTPFDFSPAQGNSRRTGGSCGTCSRRRSRYGPGNDVLVKERPIETTGDSMAIRLARHPFFVGMHRRHLAFLAACATALQFEKGQVIFRESEPADRFYLIEAGKVTMESSAGLGDPRLGWSWMFPSQVRNFTARAVEPTTAIFFDGAILREHCEKDCSFGYEFLKRMSLVMYQRIQAARKRDADHFQ